MVNILRSTPFRLALAFTLLYVVCFSIGAVSYYHLNKGMLTSRIDRSITIRFEELRSLYEQFGVERTIEAINRRNPNDSVFRFGYDLTTLEGQRLAGATTLNLNMVGWADVTADEVGSDDSSDFRFYRAKVGDHYLSYGRSKQVINEVRGNFFAILLPTFLLSSFLALAGGWYMAIRGAKRFRSFTAPMNAVAKGDLDARLPLSKRKDDIDHIAENMNNALALLQLQIEGMKQVSYNIAHDLKTPLNRLMINIEEAQMMQAKGENVESQLAQASDEASQISGTFEALLRIAQIETGSRKPKFTSLDLKTVAEQVYEIYEPVASDSGHTFVFRNQSQNSNELKTELVGDKNLLMQMIVNLIENSIDHCPENSTITITLGNTAEQFPCISVCDTGSGIPKEEYKKVFQRLYRLDTSRTTTRAGLGLSLVKAVADLHEAEIHLSDNQPGLCVLIVFNTHQPR